MRDKPAPIDVPAEVLQMLCDAAVGSYPAEWISSPSPPLATPIIRRSRSTTQIPNGAAYFSDTDRAVATSPWETEPAYPVQQVVVGVDAHGPVEAALFACGGDGPDFVEVQRWTFRR